MLNNSSRYSKLIKDEALRLGFMQCGIARADFLEEEAPRLEQWLNKNHHGQMAYMENHFEKRLDPRLLVDDAKSVISLTLNYFPEEQQQDPDAPKISKYAYGTDYHLVIKEKLFQKLSLEKALRALSPSGAIDGKLLFADSRTLTGYWRFIFLMISPWPRRV